MKVTVCSADDLPVGARRTVAAGDRDVVVFNVDGDLVALDNRCAHKGLPLADGVIRDGVLTCPAHLWRYNVTSGQRVDTPGWAVESHPVTVEGGSVVIEVPDPTTPLSIREQLLKHAQEWQRDP